jgi:MoxR-like ATPase
LKRRVSFFIINQQHPVNKTMSKESTNQPEVSDVQAVAKLKQARENLTAELRKTIVGMEPVIDEVLIAIFSRGHALLEGVPGLAKTLLVSSIAKTLSLSFKRIQFTPDLMPSDITGSELLQDDPTTGARRFMFSKGPIFANIVLADEINRTPPKTQAALLEAMQEKMVSAGGDDFELDLPFFVLATQNPLALTRSPKRSSTASCSRSTSATRASRRRSTSCAP